MANVSTVNDSRILHFSNPNVCFMNIPTGTANDWNTQNMIPKGCEVEKKRSGVQWEVIPQIPDKICRDDIYTSVNLYIRAASPGQSGYGPYRITWTTDDGQTGTDNPFVFNIPKSDFITISYTVTSADGVTIDGSQTVQIDENRQGICDNFTGNNSNSRSIKNISSLTDIIYPNPVTENSLTIKGKSLSNLSHFEITNSVGQSIGKGKLDSNISSEFEIILPEDIQNGMYILSIHDKNAKISIYKFIKQ